MTGGTRVGDQTQPRERTTRKCKNTTNMRAAPTPTCLHREQKVCRRMDTSSRQGGSNTPPPRAQVWYRVVPRRAHERSNERPARATNRDQKNQMAFGQGVVVKGG